MSNLRVLNRSYANICDDIETELYSSRDVWSNYSKDDIGIVLLSLLAGYSYTANYYFNKYLSNSYLSSNEYKSLIKILNGVGYYPQSKEAGAVTLRCEWVGCASEVGFNIPVDCQLTFTNNGMSYPFTTIKNYYVQAGTVYTDFDVVQGEFISTENNITDILKSNKIKLDENVSIGYTSLVVGGVSWERIENINFTDKIGRYFSVEKDTDGIFYICLMGDWKNYILDEEVLNVSYLKCDGKLTYFNEDGTFELSSSIVDDAGEDISSSLSFYPVDSFSNGAAEEDINESKKGAPKYMSTFNRAITSEDYGILCKYIPGVALSKGYDWNDDYPELRINKPFKLKLVVAPNGGGELPDYIKEKVEGYFYEHGWLRDIEVIGATYVTVNLKVAVNIGVYRNTAVQNDIYNNIVTTIKNYFEVGNVDFGTLLKESTLISQFCASDIRISFMDLLDFADTQLGPTDIPILGNLDVSMEYNSVFAHDSGVGSDNIGSGSSFNSNKSDIGTSTERVTTIAIGINVTDSGTGTELVSKSISVSDAGTGGDARGSSTDNILFTDSGTGVDSKTITMTKTATDSGAGSEQIGFTDRMTKDSGAGAETRTLSATITLADAGVEDDGISSEGGGTQMTDNDTGAGNDIKDIDITSFETDAGTGADIKTLVGNDTLLDSAYGTDIKTLNITRANADAGVGADVKDIDVSRTNTDAGTGSDTKSLTVSLLGAESGVAVENETFYLTLTDSGVGSDVKTVKDNLYGVMKYGTAKYN